MKLNKKIFNVLEQYYSSLNEPQNDEIDPSLDVPNAPDDKEYKTNLIFPPMTEDFEEPEIKTKKGKTILREPPDEDLDSKDITVKVWSNDNTVEEMINVIDEEVITEQPKEKVSKEPTEAEDDNGMGDLAQTNMGEQNPESGQDPNSQQGMENPDPTQMMGGAQDPSGMSGLGGVGGDQSIDPLTGQPKKTSQEVGRIFELKKIYSRLLSIESQLSFSSDIVLLKLRKYVSDAVELFETLISNVDAFKDEIDEIIVMYYDFLEEIYEILKKYYKKKQSEEQGEQNKKNAKSLP